MAGISRSATSVIAYLMKKHKWSVANAMARVKSKRPQICPNSGFRMQLLQWQKTLDVREDPLR